MSGFHFLKDGEWITLRNKFRFRCCDCGLVHDIEYRKIMGSREVEIRMYRNKRSTSISRRYIKAKLLSLAATVVPDVAKGEVKE